MLMTDPVLRLGPGLVAVLQSGSQTTRLERGLIFWVPLLPGSELVLASGLEVIRSCCVAALINAALLCWLPGSRKLENGGTKPVFWDLNRQPLCCCSCITTRRVPRYWQTENSHRVPDGTLMEP